MDTLCAPKQIARELSVSTTTLRRYEEQDLIPEVPRTASNRRYYTPTHRQAIITIRALLQGYEIPIVYESMRKIKQGRAEEALWLINQQLHDMQVEKQRVESILTMIKQADFSKYRNYKITDAMTIGEVAEIAGVNSSAIRHWEKEGLIRSERNHHNGYRVFSSREIKKNYRH